MNILMALMQLDIGGAETHVVELSKELKRRGHNIFVVSRGGVYQEELEAAGIKCYIAPLHSKKPADMMASKKILKSIIENEKIDLVHSHTRISSFILGKLHKKMKFPFVTTAHWIFDTRFGLKYLTDWGQKALSVSEDIKEYLMKNYKMPEEDITVTVNGIDVQKFSKDTDKKPVSDEFKISEEDNLVVYVSRMDESRSLVAHQLIESVVRLDNIIENLKCIIVGDGDDFENVKKETIEANEKLGREAIMLAGARVDIDKLVAPAKLFVGVSRAALEAMASEKPTIIAGNEGYVGLFSEDKLPVCLETNFCLRGCEMSTTDLLAQDIGAFFGLWEEDQEKLGKYGREVVLKYYSVARMADDAEKVYKKVMEEKSMKIVVSGYYGFNNSGDDALLAAIIENIRSVSEKAEITVLSNSPKDTKSVYKTKAVYRYNIFSLLYEIATCDVLLSGGGTLIQDATSTKSLYYYLLIIRLAKLFGKKVMLYANGIGPLKSFKNIETTKNVLNEVDLITLRDENSQKELERIGVNRPEIHVTADPAFLINPNESGDDIFENYGIPKDKDILCVSVRRAKGNPADFEQMLADFCDYAWEKHGLFTVFLPMQQRVDYAVSASIKDKMKNKGVIIGTNYQAASMLSLISKMKICLGMRLHTLIYSASCNVPIIGIVYDPKVNGFLEYIGEENYINSEDITKEKLCEYLDKVCENYDSVKSHLKFNVRIMKNKAEENAELLRGLLGGGKR